MYQIVMSLIHDLDIDQQYDADSVVTGIPDLGTALQSVIVYTRNLNRTLGWQFIFTDNQPDDSPEDVPFRVHTGPYTSPGRHGPATCYIEVQRTKVRTDPEEIVRHLVVASKFTSTGVRNPHPDLNIV